jgi:hypothetical protein
MLCKMESGGAEYGVFGGQIANSQAAAQASYKPAPFN